MSARRRVCILSFSNIAWDSRVQREIRAASQDYDVDVIGYGEWNPPEGVRYYAMSRAIPPIHIRYPLYLLGRFSPNLWEDLYWRRPAYASAYEILMREQYILVHANDWDALPVAGRAALNGRCRALFDAHEYTPGQTDKWLSRLLLFPYRVHLLKKYHPQAAAMITVSGGVQQLYRENFGWESEVILNTPAYVPVSYRPVDSANIRVAHVGAAMAVRNLEDMIRLVPWLDERFSLVFMLVGNPQYVEQLKAMAKNIAPCRIVFTDPVPPAQVVEKLAQFDIGIPLIRATHLSYLYSMPNKLFEYMMAGLAIAVTPLPSMKKLVEEHWVGTVSTERNYQSLAKAMNALSAEEINRFKQNSLILAKTMNAEVEMGRLMEIYRQVLGD